MFKLMLAAAGLVSLATASAAQARGDSPDARIPCFWGDLDGDAYRDLVVIGASGTVRLLNDDELSYVMCHEIAHIMSDHVLYKTMTVLLLNLAGMGFPIVGLAARAVLVGLLEWSRKSELSCDRAGLLATQDPTVMMGALMRIAGGSRGEELDLDEFIAQSDEYRDDKDTIAGIYKVLAALGSTHPFAVVRVAELREWIDSGDYERILGGDYRSLDDDKETPYSEDLGDAGGSYARSARRLIDDVGEKVGNVTSRIAQGWQGDEVWNDED